ncbi:hypothetical protein ACHAXN_008220 [Cyclotella atomus]
MNSPRRQERKRRRGIDPDERNAIDVDDVAPNSANDKGVGKRMRRRLANDDVATCNNSQYGARLDRAATDTRTNNLEPVGTPLPKQTRPFRQSGDHMQHGTVDDFRRDSSASQMPLNVIRNGTPKTSEKRSNETKSPIDRPATAPINVNMGAEEDDYYKCSFGSDSSLYRRRRYIRVVTISYLLVNIIFLISLSAVLFTLDFNHKLFTMEKRDLHYNTVETYAELLKTHQQTANSLQQQLTGSQQLNMQLKESIIQAEAEHDAKIEEFRAIFKQHENDLNEALVRIKVLRGNNEHKVSALDMACLRMDELLEENNELSHHLNEAKKQQLFVARDKELIHTVESLTQQLKIVSEEKDNLSTGHDDLNTSLMALNADYDLLEFKYHEMAFFLSPILTYIQCLLRTSEQQHAIILELTSLVHSLHSSLDLSRSDAQIQSTESQYAVGAVAAAAGEIVVEQTARYELERTVYMNEMEQQLTRMEDEALGAVQAVAAAAGKLEYERKIEEETRWKRYIEEVEKTLGGIGAHVENDKMMSGDDTKDASNKERDDLGDLQGIVETSVLRAAISRKIEEGIASLQKYIHPYNYLKEKKRYSWEIESDSE